MEHKSFHLSDILSVVTGKLLSTQKIEGVYSILCYMTGENLYTHQISSALDECRPYLIEQYPFLRYHVNVEVNPQDPMSTVWEAVERHGECLNVQPILKIAHK